MESKKTEISLQKTLIMLVVAIAVTIFSTLGFFSTESDFDYAQVKGTVVSVSERNFPASNSGRGRTNLIPTVSYTYNDTAYTEEISGAVESAQVGNMIDIYVKKDNPATVLTWSQMPNSGMGSFFFLIFMLAGLLFVFVEVMTLRKRFLKRNLTRNTEHIK